MTRNNGTAASTQAEIPDVGRCRYTSRRKGRCSRNLIDDATGLCILHHRLHIQKIQSQTRAVSQELLADGPNLENREDVRAALSNLFRLVAQKRIGRTDASLLAYIASLVFQGLPPADFSPSGEPGVVLNYDGFPIRKYEIPQPQP